ncbi:MAG: hypothetical protein U1E76_00305 [Planctomycetota bacterium]
MGANRTSRRASGGSSAAAPGAASATRISTTTQMPLSLVAKASSAQAAASHARHGRRRALTAAHTASVANSAMICSPRASMLLRMRVVLGCSTTSAAASRPASADCISSRTSANNARPASTCSTMSVRWNGRGSTPNST